MYDQNTNQSLFSLRITENTKIQLKSTAAVAGVAAIFSLINSVLGVISSFMARTQTRYSYYEGFEESRVSVQRTGSIVVTMIWLGISILLFYFLNRFASQTKQGLNGSNQQLVNSGLGGLSSWFITVGILIIIGLSICLIVFAIALSYAGR